MTNEVYKEFKNDSGPFLAAIDLAVAHGYKVVHDQSLMGARTLVTLSNEDLSDALVYLYIPDPKNVMYI